MVAVVSSLSALALPIAATPFARPTTAGLGSSWSTFATSKVFAADGSVVAKLHGEVNRDPVPLAQIPRHVRNAVIAIEDRRFWTHGGVDPRGIVRAAVQNLGSGGGLQGGSTLSQQLVKNVYLREEPRTLLRKGVEAFLAFGLEKTTSKEEILEGYLNTVYFGRGVYGVQAAAESFFHKDVKDLTLAEAAFLAGLIHMPARYDWALSDEPQARETKERAARERRDVVLDVMAAQGFISRQDGRAASSAPLDIQPPADKRWRHPYFIDAVLRELGVLRNRGEPRPDRKFDVLGTTHDERAQAVYRHGLRIYTTLDLRTQETAERSLETQLPPGQLPKLSAAAVSVEPGTGFVRALIGGRDYYPPGCEAGDETSAPVCRHAKVNLALGSVAGGSGRHAGSAFKPFVLAAALEDGISLRQQVRGSPFVLEYEGNRWKVENYDGSGAGNMSVVDATVKSVNAAFARLEVDYLGDGDALVGSRKVAALSRKLGFPFPTPDELRKTCGDRYNQGGDCTPADNVPAIALGAKEVSPLRMAAAYATFAADGLYAPPTTISKITDASGKVLYEAKPEPRRAIERSTALGVSHVLQEVIKRGTGKRAALERPAAGKTGTSQQWRDAWFAGYVPQLTSVIWLGNPLLVRNRQGVPMLESMTPSNGYPTKIVGGSYPARIWGAFMGEATAPLPVETFEEPPEALFKKPEPPKEDTADLGVMGLGRAEARISLQRAGHRVVVISECPPGGSGEGGMRVWKQEVGDDRTIYLYVSRAVCR